LIHKVSWQGVEVEQAPSRVVVNVTDPGFAPQVATIRTQVAAAGGELTVFNGISTHDFLDKVSELLTTGPVSIVDQGLVTGQAMIDALVKGHWSASAALVRSVGDSDTSHLARVAHRRLVSASSDLHKVSKPTHEMLGFVRIGNDVAAREAVAHARAYAASSTTPLDAVDVVTVALVRGALSVVAITPTGVCERIEDVSRVHVAQGLISNQDEAQVRTQRALRADDGFYSTFVLRKLSRRLSMFAVRRGWTPNQITVTSLVLALVVSAGFATGWWPLMIAGAIGIQLSIIIDCSDGEVARYTGVSSQRGAWLDAATDRVKEYAIYAGLAAGASHHGLNLWGIAMAMMVLQTVRHMSDYNFNAVQVIRETALVKVPMHQATDGGVVSNGALLDASADLNSNSKLRWLKKVIHMPIGERWLVLSIGAAFNAPAFALYGLFALGLVGLGYTTLGRILRSRSWNHPKEVSGYQILERQFDAGRIGDWMFADGHTPFASRYAWSAPALLRLFELGLVAAVSQVYPFGYLWIFAVSFHHYDSLYRSLAGFQMPAQIRKYGLGFIYRTLIVIIFALGFVIPFNIAMLLGGLAFFGLFVVYASKQWLEEIG
jgi:phosphatidylserine synthase